MSMLGDFSELFGDDFGGAARAWKKRHGRKNRMRNLKPRKRTSGTCLVGESFGRRRFTPTNVHPALRLMRKSRIEKGISLIALEKKLNLGSGTAGRWERGEMVPSMLKYFDWCEALGIRLPVEGA